MNTRKQAIHGFTQYELSKVLYTSGILSKIKLSPSARLLLIGLANHHNPKKEDVYPSMEYLSAHTGVSVRQIERLMPELKNAGLIIYETKRVNHYKFTPKFFELVGLSGVPRQDVRQQPRQDVHETNNHEHKKNIPSFYKNEGINYPAAKILEFKRDEKTPLNDKETGIKFIKDLAEMQNNPVIRKKIDEVIQIHDLASELCPDLASLSLERIKHTKEI